MINLVQIILNESFLNKWQTLIGAAAGPFLAIVLSGIGFWIRLKYLAQQERRESIRQTEVSVTRTINDMYRVRLEIVHFIGRLKGMISAIIAIDDDATYVIEETNFPHLKEIFIDSSLPILKFKSYYLHNKLMISDAGVSATNHILKGLKESYATIIANNKFLIALKPLPRLQRDAYTGNLEGFFKVIEKDVLLSIDNGIKALLETKLYNLKLMKHPLLTVWKYEGKSFKYFRDKEGYKNRSGNLEVLDILDKLFEKEVKESLDKAKERVESKVVSVRK